MGVAVYQLSEQLPEHLKNILLAPESLKSYGTIYNLSQTEIRPQIVLIYTDKFKEKAV